MQQTANKAADDRGRRADFAGIASTPPLGRPQRGFGNEATDRNADDYHDEQNADGAGDIAAHRAQPGTDNGDDNIIVLAGVKKAIFVLADTLLAAVAYRSRHGTVGTHVTSAL